MSSKINYKRVWSLSDSGLTSRVSTLENNVYKILYFQAISSATGTITKPTNSTILLDQFYSGGDAIVETLSNGQPTGQSPLTSGGSVVSVTSFNVNGNYVLSGTPSAFDVALVYILTIKAVDYGNLNVANIMAMEEISSTSGFIPYVGATSNVDIGAHDFNTSTAITAGTFNAVIITPPLGSATLTISDGKTLTVSNNATVSGTNTGDQDLSSLAPKASPTFTGTVVLPATTSIGNVSNTELGYLDGVTSAIQTQFDNVGEFIQLGGTTFAPADSTTYYFGLNNQLAPGTSTASREFSFSKTGTVTRFMFTVAMSVAGTSENVAVSLRNITTSTDNSIGNITIDAGTNGTGVFNFTTSIAIANTTDRYSIKIVAPAWVTNPTGVYSNVRLFNKA